MAPEAGLYMALKCHTGLETPCFNTFCIQKDFISLRFMEDGVVESYWARREPVNLGLWDPYGVMWMCVPLFLKILFHN